MLGLSAHRRTVFAIQSDIKNTGTKFLRHVSLQLQAFAHPRFDAAVVITNRDHYT
jgi:hypothetical protein